MFDTILFYQIYFACQDLFRKKSTPNPKCFSIKSFLSTKTTYLKRKETAFFSQTISQTTVTVSDEMMSSGSISMSYESFALLFAISILPIGRTSKSICCRE